MNISNEEDGAKKPKTRREKWRHAFAWGEEYEEKLTEEDTKMLDAFARAIVKRGMTAPALLWFVTLKPLNVIGANILQAVEVLFKDLALEIFIKRHFMPSFEHGAFVKAIEKRKGIDMLLDLIEHHDAESSRPKKKVSAEEDKEKTEQE